MLPLHVDGELISTTEEHPFWVVDQGWVEASDLRVGDLLITEDGVIIDVDWIGKREGDFEVYNFEVEDFHTYFVSDLEVLVHNAWCGQGSGPKHGLIEISSNSKSTKIIENLNPKQPMDFIFDPIDGRFVVGGKKVPFGHDGIMDKAGDGIRKPTTVGGRIARKDGKLFTDEWSGHYGDRWTPEIRRQFEDFKQKHGLDIPHEAWQTNRRF